MQNIEVDSLLRTSVTIFQRFLSSAVKLALVLLGALILLFVPHTLIGITGPLTAGTEYVPLEPSFSPLPVVDDSLSPIETATSFQSQLTIPISLVYSRWVLSSPPTDGVSTSLFGPNDSLKMIFRAKLAWYNASAVKPRIPIFDTSSSNSLNLRYYPQMRGPFNSSIPLANIASGKNWGGIMQRLPQGPVNLLSEGITALDIWMRPGKEALDQKIYVEIGTISEDIIANRRLNSEDMVIIPRPDGQLGPGEDIGLDMIDDVQEQQRNPAFVQQRILDPSGDDYSYIPGSENVMGINGTEGNGATPNGRIPDTEDLSGNGQLDTLNAYYSYEFPLDTNAVSNRRVVAQENGWTHYRVPIRDFTGEIGSPFLNQIEHVRIGFVGVSSDSLQVSIAALGFSRANVGAGGEQVKDTTYVVYLDSTARLAQWTHVRKDKPQVAMFPDRTYPLYAANRSTQYRREVVFDSTGERVLFKESIGGMAAKIPVSLSLDEYIAAREKDGWRRILAEEAHRSGDAKKTDELGDLLSNITQIQIPIPPNPIFSIFGKPEIKLNISGAVDIKAGFRNVTSDQTTLSVVDQTRNEPDFRQEVQVNVNGTIGDKLNILADWNTQRTFEYENQLKIKYTGYDDEIVQSVEAGNVSLATPSAFIGSSQALFGVKAKFQTGPLTLTTIASQKKGQIKEVSVSGGSQENLFEIRAVDYSTDHYFVDTSYIHLYEQYYQNEPALVEVQSQIVEEEVWVSQTGLNIQNTTPGIAYISLPPRPNPGYADSLRNQQEVASNIEAGRFTRLDPGQYALTGLGYLGVLTLNTNVQDGQIVALAYRRADGTQFGEFSADNADSTLILKMVKPRVVRPNDKVAWRQLLKNIYKLRLRNVKRDGFALDVVRDSSAGVDQRSILGKNLLNVLGLDIYNRDNQPTPGGDNEFDFRVDRTIDPVRGEVIFPFVRPFDVGIDSAFRSEPDSIRRIYRFPEIYDTTMSVASRLPGNKYAIKGKATGESSSKFNLGFNIVEGSVQVLLNGAALTPNADYTVDYILGEVVIRKAEALLPGANLQIKFEQNDLFQLASKTLLGARGDVAVSQKTNFGFTVMNLNQQSLSDKVRLGEEPNTNTVLGIDGATSFELPILTKAIDALPFIDTRDVSSMRISGEAAYVLPDPNTRKSSIQSDGGSGVAYIDDFEGARRTIPLGVNFLQWTQASHPADQYSRSTIGTDSAAFMNHKGRMIWYNILPTLDRLTDVFPNKRVGNAANDQVTVLDINYFPKLRGQFNYSNPLENAASPLNWAGIMKPISLAPTKLLAENISYIEIWMQVDSKRSFTDPDTLYLDLGTINEDAIPNNQLNSEDLILNPNPTGTLQPGEDIGLDMVPDEQEPGYNPSTNPDPSGDNYSYNNTIRDFSHINGTDGNLNGPGGRTPDTEDLNFNAGLDRINDYFQYKLALVPDSSMNPQIVGGGNRGPNGLPWYQYRMPIRDFAAAVGTPDLDRVETIRLYFVNARDSITVRIADFSLVGNQWEEADKNDTTFAVSVVSIEETPDYKSPPGVVQERDKTRPDENIFANEQSLAVTLTDFLDGREREARKFYTFRPLDVFNYKTMKMFVWGDPSLQYIDETNYDAEFFFRFGADTSNFYEYRAPLRADWNNEVIINFEELTAIKQGRDSVNIFSRPHPVTGGPPGSAYRVLGNPSLTQLRYLALGVTNPLDKGVPGRPLNGQVRFNELRVINVEDSPGLAYRVDTQLKLADLGTAGFNYARTDPNFHSLEQRFGSRQTGTNWGVNTSVQLERFFPTTWAGTSIPFSYSHTENQVELKYLPNSDILVSAAAQQAAEAVRQKGGSELEAQNATNEVINSSQSKVVTETYAVPSLRFGFPTNDWFIRDTFNKLTLGFNYTTTKERSPAVSFRNAWSWNGSMRYAVTLPPDYSITPFTNLFEGLWGLDEYKGYKLFFPITSFSWSIAVARGRNVSQQRQIGSQEFTTRNFTASRQFGFSWKISENGLLSPSGDYNVNIESSLLHLETDSLGRQRLFSDILNDIFFSDKLINFGRTSRLTQRLQINTRPNIPNIFNIKKYLDLTFGYSVDYSWQDNLQNIQGKSSGFTNNINLSSNFRMKALFEPLFESTSGSAPPATPAPRGRRSSAESEHAVSDTSAAADTTKSEGPSKLSRLGEQLKSLTRIIIKIPFLDYENINVSFTQTNVASNSGVVGRTGFANFWAVPFIQGQRVDQGPKRLYQLGLLSDPSGSLTNFGTRSKFPFFGWDVEPGIRAPGANLSNNYRQTNRLTFKTNRALWEGARLDLTWNIGWSTNKTQTVVSDSLGIQNLLSTTTTGSIDRSFLTFPDFLVFSLFGTGLKKTSKIFSELKRNGDSTRTEDEKLSQAFEEGFEALPLLRKIFGQYYPRVNWSIRWDGLEKIPMFSNFVSRLSLDHTYSSNYTRNFRSLPGREGEKTDGQRISYGFSPLVGLNFTFKEALKGNLGANVRYNTTTSYDLSTAQRSIIETLSQELSVTASYSRRGFEFPLFGVSLNNDIDISFSYAVSVSKRNRFEIAKIEFNTEGDPLEGSTRTTIEPRIRYVLSSRVTASVYYKHIAIKPEVGSAIPGTTTNEAGLDLHISIQP